MAMFNSKANDTDDAEYTLIADAIKDDPYYQPRLPQARQKSKDEFYHVDRASTDWIQEMEQILEFYRQELQPEANSQSHVHHQFLLRLIDLIRPHYTNDQKKLEHFDKLFQDIIGLYERETVKQRNATEELRKETAYWQRCSLVSTHEPSARPNVQLANEDLTEFTQSIKQLEQILEAQQSRIKELIELVSMQKGAPARMADPIPLAIEKGMLDTSQEDLRRLSRQISNTRDRRCRICEHVFSHQASEDEIVQHLIVCTTKTPQESAYNQHVENQYVCPICHEKLDSSNENLYLQHLHQCYATNTN